MAGSSMQASSGLAGDQAVQLVNALQHLEQVVVTGESLCRFAPVHCCMCHVLDAGAPLHCKFSLVQATIHLCISLDNARAQDMTA